MRVVHVCAYYVPAFSYGGPVRSLHALCRAQRTSGIDVEVFTTTANGSSRVEAAPEGRLVDGVLVRYFDLSPPVRLLGSARLEAALPDALSRADVIHLHGLFNRTIWSAAACLRDRHRPYVLSPRGMLERAALAHHGWRKRVAWQLRDRAVVAGAAVLHASSEFEEATLTRLCPSASVVAVPNPVESDTAATPADAAACRQALGIPADAPLVLALGRLHAIKRLDLVAEAFLRLWRRVPDAHLVVAGPDEQHLQPLLERLLEPAAGHVHFTGVVTSAGRQALLAAATVLVQCSDSESFGMSVAEALASGVPVVVTRTCPWRPIETWGCGFWVEQDAGAVGDALQAIVADRDLAARQGRAGRQLVAALMSPERVARRWARIYEDVCRAHAA